jgi:hypothetical protein
MQSLRLFIDEAEAPKQGTKIKASFLEATKNKLDVLGECDGQADHVKKLLINSN